MHAWSSVRENSSGLIVFSAAGKLLFASARAEMLLTFHFPACAGDGPWPKRLSRWIAQATPAVQRTRGLVCAALRSERKGRRLVVRVVETRLERILLLEEDRIWTNGANRRPTALGVLGLTERESEVLCWVAEGKSNAEIATILLIALRTVKKHLEHIFEKLGVENRTCAAARASEVLHEESSMPSTARSNLVMVRGPALRPAG